MHDDNLAYVEVAIEMWRMVRHDTQYYTPGNSPNIQELHLIDKIRESYQKLTSKSIISNTELGQLLGKESLFLKRLDPNNPRPFSGKELAYISSTVKNQMLNNILKNPLSSSICRNILRELGTYRSQNRIYYLKYEHEMIQRQLLLGSSIDEYAPGWRSARIRRIQNEILWTQLRGRCAISGKHIDLSKDSSVRHHIEFIKSKCGIIHLVLVLDEHHGYIKKDSKKQYWIDTLLLAKEAFERGEAPLHWKLEYKKMFAKSENFFKKMNMDYYL